MSVAATEAFTAANVWAEINAGPYAAVLAQHVTSGDDQGIANILNDKNGVHNGPVNHADVSAGTVSSLIDWIEYDSALTLGQKGTFDSIQSAQVVPIGSSNVQGFYDAAFTVITCPNTRGKLQSYYTQTGSRTEVLFGTGVNLTAQQVNIARVGLGATPFPV